MNYSPEICINPTQPPILPAQPTSLFSRPQPPPQHPLFPDIWFEYTVGPATIYLLTNVQYADPKGPSPKRNETFMRGVGVSCGGEMDGVVRYGNEG